MSNIFIKTLTILNNATESEEFFTGQGGFNRAMTLNVLAPAALDGTVKPYVAAITGGTYVIQTSSGNDITIAAGKATPLSPLVAGSLKLVSDATETADRVFYLIGWPMP